MKPDITPLNSIELQITSRVPLRISPFALLFDEASYEERIMNDEHRNATLYISLEDLPDLEHINLAQEKLHLGYLELLALTNLQPSNGVIETLENKEIESVILHEFRHAYKAYELRPSLNIHDLILSFTFSINPYSHSLGFFGGFDLNSIFPTLPLTRLDNILIATAPAILSMSDLIVVDQQVIAMKREGVWNLEVEEVVREALSKKQQVSSQDGISVIPLSDREINHTLTLTK